VVKIVDLFFQEALRSEEQRDYIFCHVENVTYEALKS